MRYPLLALALVMCASTARGQGLINSTLVKVEAYQSGWPTPDNFLQERDSRTAGIGATVAYNIPAADSSFIQPQIYARVRLGRHYSENGDKWESMGPHRHFAVGIQPFNFFPKSKWLTAKIYIEQSYDRMAIGYEQALRAISAPPNEELFNAYALTTKAGLLVENKYFRAWGDMARKYQWTAEEGACDLPNAECRKFGQPSVGADLMVYCRQFGAFVGVRSTQKVPWSWAAGIFWRDFPRLQLND